MCPVTFVPGNSLHPFLLIRSCGHVVSKKAIFEVQGEDLNCPMCFLKYTKKDLLELFPTQEEQPGEKKRKKKERPEDQNSEKRLKIT
jgi:hypothetical protein